MEVQEEAKSHTISILKPAFPFKSPIFLVLVMSAVALLLSAVFFAVFFHHSAASRPHGAANDPILLACRATRYPDLCQSSLNQAHTIPPNTTSPIQIIQSAIDVSSQNLKNASAMVQSVVDSSSGNPNLTRAATQCLEGLGYADYRTNSTLAALSSGNNKDARAWMSASVSYQFGCWGGLKTVNDTRQVVVQTMSFLQTLTNISSNALSMLFSYDNFGPEMGSWAQPKTERDGYYEGTGSGAAGGSVLELGVPANFPANVTVCKDGSGGCYKTVQEAVNAAPDNDVSGRYFVIRIKEGVYDEIVRVPFVKKKIVFLGDGMGKTVITGSLNVGQIGMTTYDSATVGVLGDGFMASGLTFQNTAGPVAHQAVAFRSSSDFSVIENCEFLGNQDTLYAHSLRQLYKKCRIQGNVDFIFGNSAAVFQDCIILVAPRQFNPEHGEDNAVTAHGRSDPAMTTGFVFQNCIINGTEEYLKYYYSKPQVHKTFLGRPWKEYSRTVFINSTLEVLIRPEGWMPWSGDFALKTLFYGEYGNSGPGANVSQRVQWSSQIPEDRVFTYSVQNFIQGNEWSRTTSLS